MFDKINISAIVSGHLRTLSDVSGGRVLKTDIALFFVVPALIAVGASISVRPSDSGYLNGIVSLYAIFSALLINAQVALYSIFRSWSFSEPPDDRTDKVTKNEKVRIEREKYARRLVKEVNTNLSYLILFCVAALTICLIFMVISIPRWIEIFVVFGALAHFVLTLLMAIKRTYRLFDAEYEN